MPILTLKPPNMEQEPLDPHITHINASDEFLKDPDNVKMINTMVKNVKQNLEQTLKHDILIKCVKDYQSKLIPGGKYLAQELLVMSKEIALEAMEQYGVELLKSTALAEPEGVIPSDEEIEKAGLATEIAFSRDVTFNFIFKEGANWMKSKLLKS